MTSEERFGKWVGIGVPSIIAIGIVGAAVLHAVLSISWNNLTLPIGIYVLLQEVFYLCVFWARNLVRSRGQHGPMSILVGAYLWGSGMLIIRYGTEWKVLPAPAEYAGFSACMVFATVVLWFAAPKLGSKLGIDNPQRDK